LLGDFNAKAVREDWSTPTNGNKSLNENKNDTAVREAVEKVWGRLTVSKQCSLRLHMERFNRTQLSEVGGKDQYSVEISDRFGALENAGDEVYINRAWEAIKENIIISSKQNLEYSKLKKHMPLFEV
jgi:NCAIR mutase (PurE)-related protein